MTEFDQPREVRTPAEIEVPVHGRTMATIALVHTPRDIPRDPPDSRRSSTLAVEPELAEGSRVGRFMILRKLGEGGMGVVFVGYDSELDRRVALKLLRRRHGDERAITRLLREAQGLARLSHPNVVQIYEVGAHAGAVFIAMELIVGRTLSAYLADEPERSWAEVIHVLLQAGRGVSAAHAAKLVHRDFKPDNVMVGDDGRVCVLDFGLVRGEVERVLTESERVSASESGRMLASLDCAMTVEGALLGTPAYMAPEQIAGTPADALSDQFSFCVAAYEALYGVPPFVGRTLDELAAAIHAGQLRPPPRGSKVPRRVHAALSRGLSADPSRRWPDMDSLLAQLAASLAVRRGWMWTGIAAAMAVVAVVVYGLAEQVRARDDVIEVRRQQLAEVNHHLESALARSEEQLDDLQHVLAVSRGLHASSLIAHDREDEALLAALEAVGPYTRSEPDTPPPEALRALENVLACDAQIVRPAQILDAKAPTIWDAAFSPDGTRVVVAGHDGDGRIYDARTGKLLTRLLGHGGAIKAARFLPDGRRVVTASYDHSLRLWNADNGATLTILHADAEVVALALTRDGNLLAATSYDGLTRIWDTSSEARIATLDTHAPRPPALSFDPSGTRLATTSADNGVTIWTIDRSRPQVVLSGHDEPVSALAWAPDGASLATVSYDGSARLWDPSSGDMQALLGQHHQRLYALAFSPDGTRVVVGGEDRVARVYDLADGRVLARLDGHHGWITELAFTNDSHRVISASPDGTARVWDSRSGKLLAILSGHEGMIDSLQASPDGTQLLTAGDDGTARVWNLDIDTSVVKREGHRGSVNALAFAPDSSSLVSAGADGTAKLWRPATGELLTTLAGHDDEVVAVAYAAGGRLLATASWDDRVRVWDPESGMLLHTLHGHGTDVLALAWSPSGRQLASGGLDRRVHLWKPDTGQHEATLVDFEDHVNALAYSPNGEYLATGSADGIVRVWDPARAELLMTLGGHAESNCAVWLAWSPDGDELATGSCDNQALIWDPLAGERLQRMAGHRNSITALAWSPDGRQLLTASADHDAKLWNVADGQLIATASGHGGGLTALAFAPDGRSFATASKDRAARLWDAGSGELLATLNFHGGALTSLAFSPNGRYLALASQDQRVSIWDPSSHQRLSTLEDRVGLLEPGGVLEWPAPLQRLVEIGCARLSGFDVAQAAADICDPLVRP